MLIKMETTLTFILPKEQELFDAFLKTVNFKEWETTSSCNGMFVQFRHIERRDVNTINTRG